MRRHPLNENDIAKRLRAAFNDALKLAKQRGCKNPRLFIEAESGVFVLDADHEGYKRAYQVSMADRQDAIVISIYGALPPGLDTGAW